MTTIEDLPRRGQAACEIAGMLGVTEGAVRYHLRRRAGGSHDGRADQPHLAQEWAEVIEAWRRARDEAGMTDFRFRDLRHTYASHAAMAGVDVRVLQLILGHRTLAVTMRYSHLGPEGIRTAVKKVSLGAGQQLEAVK